MCNHLQELCKDYREKCSSISSDPFAIDGGVVNEFLEDYEKIFRTDLWELVKSGKLCEKHLTQAYDMLGDMAQNVYEAKIERRS